MPFLPLQPQLTPSKQARGWLRPQALALVLIGGGLWRAVPVMAQEPKLPAPVNIGDAAPAQSESNVAPVKIGEADKEKSDKQPAPVKVGDASQAQSDTAPVTIGGAAPANTPGVAPVTLKGAGAAQSTLALVAVSSLRVPVLLKQVGAGAEKVEELLQSGALQPTDLKWAVHHPRLWQEKAAVGKAAAGTIAVYDAFLSRFGEEVADAVSWEPSARAALAAELSRRGDARCVPLFEAMTAEWGRAVGT